MIDYSKRRFVRHYDKRKRISRFWLLVKLLAVVALLFSVYKFIFYLPVASVEVVAAKSLTQQKAKVSWPNYGSGAISAVGFDEVLDVHGDQSARPIASITKVITALVILEAKPIKGNEQGPSIELTQADKDIFNRNYNEDAAVVQVFVGSSLTERQILEIMLLPSAANYSETLAVWAYGSIESYLMAANAWLLNNGMSSTSVVDASGLLAGNISTPSDLITLAKLALNNPTVASISSMQQSEIPMIGTIYNSNMLLDGVSVNGIKTGQTDEAGICLLFSSVINVGGEKVTVVGSILNGTNRSQENADVKRLLASVEQGFYNIRLSSVGQEYVNYTTAWGQAAQLVSGQDISDVVWSDTPVLVSVEFDKVVKLKAGEQKGVANISVGKEITTVPLTANESITAPGLMWRVNNFFKLF